MTKFNKTIYVVKGKATILTDLDNKIDVGTELRQFQGGQYRKTVIRVPTQKYCDFIKTDTFFISELVKASTYTTVCPTPTVGSN